MSAGEVRRAVPGTDPGVVSTKSGAVNRYMYAPANLADRARLALFTMMPRSCGGVGHVGNGLANNEISSSQDAECIGQLKSLVRGLVGASGNSAGTDALLNVLGQNVTFRIHNLPPIAAIRSPLYYWPSGPVMDSSNVKRFVAGIVLSEAKNPECRQLLALASKARMGERSLSIDNVVWEYVLSFKEYIPTIIEAIHNLLPSTQVRELESKIETPQSSVDLVSSWFKPIVHRMLAASKFALFLNMGVMSGTHRFRDSDCTSHTVQLAQLIDVHPNHIFFHLVSQTSIGKKVVWYMPVLPTGFRVMYHTDYVMQAATMPLADDRIVAPVILEKEGNFHVSACLPLFAATPNTQGVIKSTVVSAKTESHQTRSYIRPPDTSESRIQDFIKLTVAAMALSPKSGTTVRAMIRAPPAAFNAYLQETEFGEGLVPIIRLLASVWGLSPDSWLARAGAGVISPLVSLRDPSGSSIRRAPIAQSLFHMGRFNLNQNQHVRSFTMDVMGHMKAAQAIVLPEVIALENSAQIRPLIGRGKLCVVSDPMVAERVPMSSFQVSLTSVTKLLTASERFPANFVATMQLLRDDKLTLCLTQDSEDSRESSSAGDPGVLGAGYRAITVLPMEGEDRPMNQNAVVTFHMFGVASLPNAMSLSVSPRLRQQSSQSIVSISKLAPAVASVLYFSPRLTPLDVLNYVVVGSVVQGREEVVKWHLCPHGLYASVLAMLVGSRGSLIRDGPQLQTWHQIATAAHQAQHLISESRISPESLTRLFRLTVSTVLSINDYINRAPDEKAIAPQLRNDLPIAELGPLALSLMQNVYRVSGYRTIAAQFAKHASTSVVGNWGADMTALRAHVLLLSQATGYLAAADAMRQPISNEHAAKVSDPAHLWPLDKNAITLHIIHSTLIGILWTVYPILDNFCQTFEGKCRKTAPASRLRRLQPWKMATKPETQSPQEMYFTRVENIDELCGQAPQPGQWVTATILCEDPKSGQRHAPFPDLAIGFIRRCVSFEAEPQSSTASAPSRFARNTSPSYEMLIVPWDSPVHLNQQLTPWMQLYVIIVRMVWANLKTDIVTHHARISQAGLIGVCSDDATPPRLDPAHGSFRSPLIPGGVATLPPPYEEMFPSSLFWAVYPAHQWGSNVNGIGGVMMETSLTYHATMRELEIKRWVARLCDAPEAHAAVMGLVNEVLPFVERAVAGMMEEIARIPGYTIAPGVLMRAITNEVRQSCPISGIPMGWASIYPINVPAIGGASESKCVGIPVGSLHFGTYKRYETGEDNDISALALLSAQYRDSMQLASYMSLTQRALLQCFWAILDGETLFKVMLPVGVSAFGWENFNNFSRGARPEQTMGVHLSRMPQQAASISVPGTGPRLPPQGVTSGAPNRRPPTRKNT